MRNRARLAAFVVILVLLAACRSSGSYVVLVTATPSTNIGGGGDPASPAALAQSRPPAPTPTFIPTPDATRSAVIDPTQDQTYIVQPGDTLSQIALRFGVTVESILQANHLSDVNSLIAGQNLIIPTAIQVTGPAFKIIPDSELVYGPNARDFDIDAFLSGRDCFLCRYTEEVNGQLWTGPQIIRRVANEQSINPRLLLALLEYQSHWISQPIVDQDGATYPMNFIKQPDQVYGLYLQLDWAGKMLQTGYYGWRQRGLSATLLADGTRVGLDPAVNAGTAGVQVLLSQTRDLDQWLTAVQYSGFFATYVALFGDPFRYAVEPLLPPDLTQPSMSFPWASGESWYFTGGPHGGWGSGSAWAAVDFVPGEDLKGCPEAKEWARAVADGVIAVSEYGLVILDLDGDGYQGTGWTVVYLHLSGVDRAVVAGQAVRRGDPIGHPSCEGGVSTATHLHIARRYNGEWMAADCSACLLNAPAPRLNFDGWEAHSFGREYDGSFTRGDDYREACTCREAINTITLPSP